MEMRLSRVLTAGTALAVIVAALTGCSSTGSNNAAPHATVSTTTAKPPRIKQISVILKDNKGGTGSMTMIVSPNAAAAGVVTFTVKNIGTLTHELVVLKAQLRPLTPGPDGKVSEAGAVGAVRNIAPGATKSLRLQLDAGTYQLICNLKDHYSRGMHVPFTVE
jgi:uncharacterized cupredoxin-like copper-binding protein